MARSLILQRVFVRAKALLQQMPRALYDIQSTARVAHSSSKGV